MKILRVYDVNLLLDPSTSNSEIDNLISVISEKLLKVGIVAHVEKKLKHELAYEVRGRKTAHWICFKIYTFLGSVIQELKRDFLLNNRILRFMIIKLSAKDAKKIPDYQDISDKILGLAKVYYQIDQA